MPINTKNMSIQEKNKELTITLDNAWNSQDCDTFNQRHADNVAVFWPGQAEEYKTIVKNPSNFSKFFQTTILSTIRTRYLLQKVTILAQ
jgi:hypothetical protein